MLPSTVCAALADRDRLRLFGMICQDPGGTTVVDLHLDPKGRKALGKLLGSGMVERDGDRYVVRAERFRQAIEDPEGDQVMADANVRVAALFTRGKLASVPRPGALRTELLRYLAGQFS